MPDRIKLFFEQSWLLLVASVAFGLLLAITNIAWRQRIIDNEIAKFNKLAGAMITDAGDFKVAVAAKDMRIKVKGKDVPTEIKQALDASGNTLGWAFIAEGSGFADKIRLVVAVDKSFDKMYGFGVLSSNETPGFGDKVKTESFYPDQFKGAPAAEFTLVKIGDDKRIDSEIIAITGATVTSESVVKILNNFLLQLKTQMKEKGLI